MTKPLILCATDLAPESRNAVAVAAQVAAALGGEVLLVHATDALADEEAAPASVAPAVDTWKQRIRARRADSEARIETERARVARAGPLARTLLVEGPPGPATLRAAGSHGASLIVLGRRHRDESLIGKTIDQVIRHAPCPVLVAPPEGEPPSLAGKWLVGYDGSPLGRVAVRAAYALASRAGGTAEIVHVVAAGGIDPEPLQAPHPLDLVKSEERPSDALARISEERGVAAIAVGTHARGGLFRLLVGGTALRLLRNANRPILIVGPLAGAAAEWLAAEDAHVPVPTCATHVVVGLDFSDASLRALTFSEALARQLGARLTVVHVIDPPREQPDPLRARVEAIVADVLGPHAADVGLEVTSGRPVEELLSIAARVGGDLLVVGTAGRTGVSRMLLGSVAESLVRQSPIPVLTTH